MTPSPVTQAPVCVTGAAGFIASRIVEQLLARGYRETELLMVCTRLYPGRQLHFPVRACTGYVEKNRPVMEQMEDIAIVLDRSDLKPEAGFVSPDAHGKCEQKVKLIFDDDND